MSQRFVTLRALLQQVPESTYSMTAGGCHQCPHELLDHRLYLFEEYDEEVPDGITVCPLCDCTGTWGVKKTSYSCEPCGLGFDKDEAAFRAHLATPAHRGAGKSDQLPDGG